MRAHEFITEKKFKWDKAEPLDPSMPSDIDLDKARDETDLADTMVRVLYSLTPREEHIVRLYYGIEDGQKHTLADIGKNLEPYPISAGRAGQILQKAMRKLKHPSRSALLRPYLAEEQTLNLPNGNWIVYKDSASRTWWASKVDNEGNQMGDAIDSYYKRDLLNHIKSLPDTYGTDEY